MRVAWEVLDVAVERLQNEPSNQCSSSHLVVQKNALLLALSSQVKVSLLHFHVSSAYCGLCIVDLVSPIPEGGVATRSVAMLATWFSQPKLVESMSFEQSKLQCKGGDLQVSPCVKSMGGTWKIFEKFLENQSVDIWGLSLKGLFQYWLKMIFQKNFSKIDSVHLSDSGMIELNQNLVEIGFFNQNFFYIKFAIQWVLSTYDLSQNWLNLIFSTFFSEKFSECQS